MFETYITLAALENHLKFVLRISFCHHMPYRLSFLLKMM